MGFFEGLLECKYFSVVGFMEGIIEGEVVGVKVSGTDVGLPVIGTTLQVVKRVQSLETGSKVSQMQFKPVSLPLTNTLPKQLGTLVDVLEAM